MYVERFHRDAFNPDRALTTWQELSAIGDIDTLRRTLTGTLGLEVPADENRTLSDNLDFAEKLARAARSRQAANAEVATLSTESCSSVSMITSTAARCCRRSGGFSLSTVTRWITAG